MCVCTRWFKYDRDWVVCKQAALSPGHIWTTLYMCPIPNGFRNRAISLYTVQTSNTQCPHTSCKVHWCWRWNFPKCIILGKLYQICHLNNNYRYWKQYVIRHPCGGGVEYLHRDPASRKRRRKGSLKSETVKYGHESYGTRTRKWLRWRGPAATVNDRPVHFVREGAPNQQTRNCQTITKIWS
jgi:hypothetical protein